MDFIGSSRLVKDIADGDFPAKPPETGDWKEPVSLEQLDGLVELQQISKTRQFFAHVDAESYELTSKAVC